MYTILMCKEFFAAHSGWRVYLQDEYGSSQDALNYMIETYVQLHLISRPPSYSILHYTIMATFAYSYHNNYLWSY